MTSLLESGGLNDFVMRPKALLQKSVTMGEGVKNRQKLTDVIYGQPLNEIKGLEEYKIFIYKIKEN